MLVAAAAIGFGWIAEIASVAV
jgi:hypothetical protein